MSEVDKKQAAAAAKQDEIVQLEAENNGTKQQLQKRPASVSPLPPPSVEPSGPHPLLAYYLTSS